MKKIALVGASTRVRAFVRTLKKDYAATHRIVAVMDPDAGKTRAFVESMELPAACYRDFDLMCREEKPDILLISTVDCYHRDFVVKGLDAKISVLCEKPLCTTLEHCRDILLARARNPDVHAATMHNARYHAAARRVKQLLDDGAIGRVNSVHYAEMLDFRHGASYFRRWNSRRVFSGGLQIHKSSHHFDKLNWWLSSKAVEVTAAGGLRRYGAAASPFRGERCQTCRHAAECRFAATPEYYRDYDICYQYADADSYKPDGCVFSPDIDIEDFLSAGIRFANGVYANYTLAAHCNFEGEDIFFEGDKGRLEMRRRIVPGRAQEASLLLHRFGTADPEEIAVQAEDGSHGGADARLCEDLFGGNASGRLASLDDGIQAVLTGLAVSLSLRDGKAVHVQSML